MGRPIKGYFFGKYNTAGNGGVGGEALYSNGTGNLNVTFTNVGAGYYAANVGATISAPTINGGTTAVVDAVYLWTGNGAIKGVHVSNAGSGYTADATITFTGANTTPATATANVLPSTTTLNAITANAWVTGDTQGRAADIVKQVGGRTYYVQNSYGAGRCKLVSTANPAAAGEMTITATFADASTFSVVKLTERLAYSSTGQAYLWNDASSTTGTVAFATASNSTTPPTVTISSN